MRAVKEDDFTLVKGTNLEPVEIVNVDKNIRRMDT